MAEPLYRQAMAIYRTAVGEAHYRFAISLNNLAALSEAKGDWSAAENYYRAACQSLRRALGAHHTDYASSLDNLAGLQFMLNKFDEADLGYKEALAIRRRALGEHHPNVAQSLNNLGLLYLAQGDYAAAESCYQQALTMRRHCLGANHPEVAQSLNNLAGLYAATGRETEALDCMQQAATMDDQMIGQHFALGSESQRLAYLSQLQGRLSAFLSLLTEHFHHHPDIVRAGFDLVLRRKALGIETLAIQREAVVGGHSRGLGPHQPQGLLPSGVHPLTEPGQERRRDRRAGASLHKMEPELPGVSPKQAITRERCRLRLALLDGQFRQP